MLTTTDTIGSEPQCSWQANDGLGEQVALVDRLRIEGCLPRQIAQLLQAERPRCQASERRSAELAWPCRHCPMGLAGLPRTATGRCPCKAARKGSELEEAVLGIAVEQT